MSEGHHAATALLAVGLDNAAVTIQLDCVVCGHAELHCARRHLALLAQLLTYAAQREASRDVRLTMTEEA